jgi:hypothetical protein
MQIEMPFFTLRVRPGLSPEQWANVAHALCRIAICPPPQTPQHRRAVAVRQCLALYSGARSNRARTLERRFSLYLSGDWRRERNLVELPEPRTVEKVCLHRLARLNDGRSLGRRQLDRIAGPL